jgi:2-dehydro-3-deoxygluconokinase
MAEVKKVVTLGEIMLRLSTPGQSRIVQADSFDVNYGGGEANVAVSLANYGDEAYFVTKVPAHEVGQAAINELRKYGVHTEYIARGGNRLGIYYLETGASMRPSKVIYDRAGSSIAEAKPSDFDWAKIFKGAYWFHFTGITPALGKNAQAITLRALKEAKKRGVIVSCDLNFRAKLWTSEEAQVVMNSYMPYVDYVIGNEEDADKCLGFKPEGTDVNTGKLSIEGYKKMFEAMVAKYHFKGASCSLRESHSATANGWSGLLYTDGKFYQSKHYEINPIIDRVGGGDSFASGLIYGLMHLDPQSAIDFAVAASALKHTIPGDLNHESLKEVMDLMGGDASGRVKR